MSDSAPRHATRKPSITNTGTRSSQAGAPDGPDADRGLREQGKATRRTAIVRAARELIQASGAQGFSMQALASAAGVSPMTPYNLFGAKQSVMAAVLDDDLVRFETRLARLRCDALDTIFRAVSLARRSYAAEPNFYAAMFRGALTGSSSDADTNFRAPRRAIWSRLVQAAIDAGQLQARPGAAFVGPAVSQIVVASIIDWTSGALPLRQFEARCHLGIALVLLGIATPSARARLAQRIDSNRKALARADPKSYSGL